MTLTTGMLISGKMSIGMETTETTPRTAINSARTTKVFGRRSASRTIHIYVDRPTRAAPAIHLRRPGAVDRRPGRRLGRLHADRHLSGDQHPGRQRHLELLGALA